MKKIILSNGLIRCFFFLTLAFTFGVVSFYASVVTAKSITLKGVTFLPSRVPSVGAFRMLQDKVKNLSNGELIIEFKGGPEVIPGGEQAMAAKRGVIDVAWVPAGRYLGLVPGLEAVELSRLTSAEERESGFHDIMLDLHKKSGLYYLGRGLPMKPGEGLFRLYTNKKVSKPEELAGQKIGRGVLFLEFLKKMGIVSVSIKRGEEYTALESGVVDGVISAVPGLVGYSGHEVVKYVIDHAFGVYNVMTLINLKAWEKLPEKLQKVLIKAQIELERDWPAKQSEIDAKSGQRITKAGMELIKFSPQDANRFVETAYDAQWEGLIKKKYPELGPKLKKMATK